MEEIAKVLRCAEDCKGCPLESDCNIVKLMSDAADAIEKLLELCDLKDKHIAGLLKEIEKLKSLAEEWEKVKQANLIAWRTAWDECYGENGTQRWDKNPDIKVFKDEN